MNMEPKMIILFAIVALSLIVSAVSLFKSCNCKESFIEPGCGCSGKKKLTENFGIDSTGADKALSTNTAYNRRKFRHNWPVKRDKTASDLISEKYNHTNQYVKNFLIEAPANVIVPF